MRGRGGRAEKGSVVFSLTADPDSVCGWVGWGWRRGGVGVAGGGEAGGWGRDGCKEGVGWGWVVVEDGVVWGGSSKSGCLVGVEGECGVG